MHLAHWNASSCTLGRGVLISGIRRCHVWLRESPEGPSSVWTAPRGPPHPAGGALPWTEPGPPPQEGLQRQASPAGLGQGIRSSAALALPRVHITCSPGIRPRCCPRHRRLGGGGQGLPAEQTHVVVRPLQLMPSSGTIGGGGPRVTPGRVL